MGKKINILVEGWLHFKNDLGMKLMNSEKIEFHNKRTDIKYDWILNLSEFKNYDDDSGLIFGPQMMFPAINTSEIPKHRKYVCNVLSQWVYELCLEINPDVNFTKLPFAVDVDRFKPSEKTGKPIIYFKQRDPKILDSVLSKLGRDFLIFENSGNYQVKTYDELVFQKSIASAPFAIWIGRHESQGFAFQETLSSDTPIFVIDAKSLRDEFASNSFWTNYLPNHELKSSAASYFDERCGLISDFENWEIDWDKFVSNLHNYKPREYVLDNLSPTACIELWYKTLNDINND